jgi:hypothetical protein
MTRFRKNQTVMCGMMESTRPDRDVRACSVDVGECRVREPQGIGEGELAGHALQRKERLWSGRLVEMDDVQ